MSKSYYSFWCHIFLFIKNNNNVLSLSWWLYNIRYMLRYIILDNLYIVFARNSPVLKKFPFLPPPPHFTETALPLDMTDSLFHSCVSFLVRFGGGLHLRGFYKELSLIISKCCVFLMYIRGQKKVYSYMYIWWYMMTMTLSAFHICYPNFKLS